METSLTQFVLLVAFVMGVIPCSLTGAEGQDSPTADAASASQATPMKYLTPAEREQWNAEMQRKLLIVKRETGPFGLLQDLTVKKIPKVTKAQQVVKSDAFPKAIGAMVIPVVMGKSFLIRGQEYRQGGIYSLEGKENKFNIKVILVTSEQIIFQNTDTQERVVKQLNALPPGFSRDKGFDAVPGMTPSSKEPGSIELEE